MTAELAKTVWSNQERTRHFLIPDNAKLPPGDFVLRTVIGRQMEVEEQAALPYQVTREEAKAWLSSQVAGMVGHAKDALMRFLSKSAGKTKRAPPRQKASTHPPTEDRMRRASHSAVNHLSASDKHALEEKARSLSATIKEVGAVVDATMTGDASEIESARERIRALRRKLGDQGIPVDSLIDELPTKLHDLLSPPHSAQDSPTQAARLEEMADLIEDIAHRIAQGMRDVARAVSSKAQ